MTLIASDGYEYEDLTQRLLGNPLVNPRNTTIRGIKLNYPRNEVAAFVAAYDKYRGNYIAKHAAGWRALSRERKRAYDATS